MLRQLTCIECPKGCRLVITKEGEHLVVSGSQCQKGEHYGRTEVEDPVRILTSTVLASDLEVKMIPVRTSQPIPKGKIQEAMKRIHAIVIVEPVAVGDIVEKGFLGLGVDLIATRSCGRKNA